MKPTAQLTLSPHLAAACIYAGAKRERAPRTVKPAGGVLAELARLGRLQ
jgi:hypothetical protein